MTTRCRKNRDWRIAGADVDDGADDDDDYDCGVGDYWVGNGDDDVCYCFRCVVDDDVDFAICRVPTSRKLARYWEKRH